MQDAPKAVWSIPYVSMAAFFSSLKQDFIAYHSSEVSSRPDCIFDIHQLCQSGFSMVYSNCYCSCSFEPKIIKIGQSSHKMYSNNILNVQESTTIWNACTKKVWKLIEVTPYIHVHTFTLPMPTIANTYTITTYACTWIYATSMCIFEGSLRGVVVSVLDCDIVLSQFKLQSCYSIHKYPSEKAWTSLLPRTSLKWSFIRH